MARNWTVRLNRVSTYRFPNTGGEEALIEIIVLPAPTVEKRGESVHCNQQNLCIRAADPRALIGSGTRVFWSVPGLLVESRSFGRIQVFCSDIGRLVGYRSFGRIQVFWSNTGRLVESRSFGRIQVFWSDTGLLSNPGLLVGSRSFDRINFFWLDPGLFVGYRSFGRI